MAASFAVTFVACKNEAISVAAAIVARSVVQFEVLTAVWQCKRRRPLAMRHQREHGEEVNPLTALILFTATVDVWPVHQKPNVFGLHANTAIGYAARFARSLWANLQNLLPETDNVAGIPDGAALSHAALGVSELLEEMEKAAKEKAKAAEQQETAGAEESQEKPPTPPPPKKKRKKRRTKRMSIPPVATDEALYGGEAEEGEEGEEGEEEEAEEMDMEEGEEEWDLDDEEMETEESSMTTPEDDSDDVSHASAFNPFPPDRTSNEKSFCLENTPSF